MHQRTAIRYAVVERLSGATSAETRVYATRDVPFRKGDLPAIAVYTLQEDVDGDSVNTAPRELTRRMALVIEGLVAPAPGQNVDDALDDLALEIETVMHADPYLGDAAADCVLDESSMEVLEVGDRLMGQIVLTYAVTYQTLAPEAPSNVADFLRVKATEDLGGEVHPDAQAVDEFDVRPEENP